MRIGSFDLDDRVLIVAEIGNNHEGDSTRGRELVRAAAGCGADAVKFQTYRTEHYVSASDASRFKRLKSYELTPVQFGEMAGLAHSLGLLFISTPFDLESAAGLEAIVDAYKIASGDNNFYALIARVAETGKPLIISAGASDLEQVSQTVQFVKEHWERREIAGQLAILHCVSSYPVPPEEANLASIPFLLEQFDCAVGYSDHTLGIDAPLLAVALGARIIEKHFTLNKALSDFRDHQLSADPDEMRDLVRRVRLASTMLGTREKGIQPSEARGAQALRRSIAAGRDLPGGHRIAWSDLTWIRPGGGLPPGDEHLLVGRTLRRPVVFGEQLARGDVD